MLAAERLHVDDTTVKVLAKIKTRTGRLWVYVRDDRPFGGQGPPAALYDYSPTRHGEHPRKILAAWSGVMQADAFSGYNALYEKGRKPAPVVEAACWAHGRRDFFDFAKLTKAPIAAEIVRRIDELFAIEREINGEPAEVRRAVRQQRSKPLVAALEVYMREQIRRLSPKNDVAKAIGYMLTRWPSFTRFLDDGRICLSNNAAERALRCVAVGRRNWTFAGSDAGGQRAAAVYSLIETCMCGWPPRCKGFVGGFDAGSAACMCPAYDLRPQPLALMRSADRVLSKMTRSRRFQVSWVSRSRRSTVASSPPSAPMHHYRQLRLKPAGFLCGSIDLAARQQRPNDPRHLVGERHGGELHRLASNQPSDPAFRKARFATAPSYG